MKNLTSLTHNGDCVKYNSSSCLSPTIAWQCGLKISKDGVLCRSLVFNSSDARMYFLGVGVPDIEKALHDRRIELPCGHCVACKFRQRRDLTTRLAHEASMYDRMCYITLTYNDDHLPLTDCGKPTLVVRDVQLFLKRLRRHLEYHYNIKGLRYYAVGEYGNKRGRPHYHLLIFGWKPNDLDFLKRVGEIDYFVSQTVFDCWKHGFVTVEDVNVFACRYCARYVSKKLVNSRKLDDDQLPEFILQSTRNGGIGATWFDKYGLSACERGYCSYRSADKIIKQPLPKYYFNRLRKRSPNDFMRIRDARIEFFESHANMLKSRDDFIREVEVRLLDLSKEREREVF